MIRSRMAACIAVGIGLALGSTITTPAQAAPLAACQWIDGEVETTYECSDFADPVTSMEIVDCWKLPPSTRTYVRYKTSAGWVRSPDLTLLVRGAKGCPEGYRFKTIVTASATLLQEMVTTRIRLVMPASTGTLDDTTYAYGKTVITYGACLVPEGTVDYCPSR